MMTALAPRRDARTNTGYDHLRYLYTAALREAETLLEILRCDFAHSLRRNPIHHILSRVKTEESIREKLARKGLEISPRMAAERLRDIAGLRIVCLTIEDVYAVSAWVKAQENLRLVRESDYIVSPKRNGYRSLHLVVALPIHLLDGVQWVPVEIQLRTLAMDFWASLEHQLCYKKGLIPPEVTEELRRCADKVAGIDRQMQRLAAQMNADAFYVEDESACQASISSSSN